jgi:hypothetical protein
MFDVIPKEFEEDEECALTFNEYLEYLKYLKQINE